MPDGVALPRVIRMDAATEHRQGASADADRRRLLRGIPLAERFRLIVPDVPGSGESDPVARLDATSFGGWLSALLRSAAAETCARGALASWLVRGSRPRDRGAPARLVIGGTPGIPLYRMPWRRSGST